ncbi:ROK family protein [Croceibacterium ferulae]|uniref:ROK family protein n=1 Tax=Croceibacterium ferulae TaxID=1854641 RepID=UPI000EAE631C|nr:ROK family protein [Croceibacterium ferulae]
MHQTTTRAAPLALGIDFGGTKIEANVLDTAGSVLWRNRVPNPGEYHLAIASIVDLVGAAEQALGTRCTIGIGTPGSPSPRTGLMRNSNSLYLNGKPFGRDLQEALGRPIRLANDANCLALSEAFDGAAAGASSTFGLIIGTGVGSGVVLDGAVLDGAHGIAGEIGHLPVPWPRGAEINAPQCWCGLAGCCETWISGTGFARAYEAANGRALSAPQIVAAAREGEPAAVQALTDYIDRLGRVLALIANLLDPEVMVLGGGMSNVAELYPALPEIVRRHAFSDLWDGRIVPARWGDASGVRGAARLWAGAAQAEQHAAG